MQTIKDFIAGLKELLTTENISVLVTGLGGVYFGVKKLINGQRSLKNHKLFALLNEWIYEAKHKRFMNDYKTLVGQDMIIIKLSEAKMIKEFVTSVDIKSSKDDVCCF